MRRSSTASTVKRFTHEWIEAVQRDYNHPSIIIWDPDQRELGCPESARSVRQQHHLKALYTLTKSLDATRLVIDNEGWEHTEADGLVCNP